MGIIANYQYLSDKNLKNLKLFMRKKLRFLKKLKMRMKG
ncbi:hypothetical protein HMPREF9013_0615 [Bulleidia extructa W1219]|uniref:Uncharacterized protein n=1 Tax=Bulleidia extructa W1219 TaxID=679192 RepID=D2MNT2_9FIRM|nr:hypothetical protein HMPREF9013_0615 [Bulleidia extructa W1219]